MADAPPAVLSPAAPADLAPGWARACAAAAGTAVPAGFAVVVVALAAGPGLWVPGYVSEAGTAGSPLAWAYRAGMLLVAAGVLLLAGSFWPLSRGAAALLLVSGLGAGTSGAVPCTAGCPLPPYEPSTPADLVHTGAAIAGLTCCALAMLLLAVRPLTPAALRRAAVRGAAVTVPLGLAEAAAMALAGRGAVTGAVERVLLCWVVAWLCGAALLRSRRIDVLT